MNKRSLWQPQNGKKRRGTIYHDRWAKDAKRDYNCYAGEIEVRGRRFRKRSLSYAKCEKFLEDTINRFGLDDVAA